MKYKSLFIFLLMISFLITSFGVAKAQVGGTKAPTSTTTNGTFIDPFNNIPGFTPVLPEGATGTSSGTLPGLNPFGQTTLRAPGARGDQVNGQMVITMIPSVLDSFSSTVKYSCNVTLYKDGTTLVKNLNYSVDKGVLTPQLPMTTYTVPSGTAGSYTTKTNCRPPTGAVISSPVSEPVKVKADGTIENPTILGPAAPAADPNAPTGTEFGCSKNCNENKLGWFNPGKEILDTICQIQCTVISWIAGAMASAFAHLVVPNLM